MDLFTYFTILRRGRLQKKPIQCPCRYYKKVEPKPDIPPYIGLDGNWHIDGKNTYIAAFPQDYKKLHNKPTLNDETIEDNLEALPITLEEIQQLIEESQL